MNSLFINVRHIVLEIPYQRVVTIIELKLIDLVFLHFQKLDFFFLSSFFNTLQDMPQIVCKLRKEYHKGRHKLNLGFRIETFELIVKINFYMFVHEIWLFIEQLNKERLDEAEHLGSTALKLIEIFFVLGVGGILLEKLNAISEFRQSLLEDVLVHLAAWYLARIVEIVLTVIWIVVQAFLHLHR